MIPCGAMGFGGYRVDGACRLIVNRISTANPLVSLGQFPFPFVTRRASRDQEELLDFARAHAQRGTENKFLRTVATWSLILATLASCLLVGTVVLVVWLFKEVAVDGSRLVSTGSHLMLCVLNLRLNGLPSWHQKASNGTNHKVFTFVTRATRCNSYVHALGNIK